MKAVAAQLGIGEEDILPMSYYLLERERVKQECNGAEACTWYRDGEIQVFSYQAVHNHELVHAIHFSAWPLRAPVLHEGLAHIFDDRYFHEYSFAWSSDTIDTALESDNASYVSFIGSYLVFWMLERYGPQSFSEFWVATGAPPSASAFRAAFDATFGAPLDEMLADVESQVACTVVTCMGEPVPWLGAKWSVQFTSACDDRTDNVTTFGYSNGKLSHQTLFEIPQLGAYEVSLTTGGAVLMPCGDACIPSVDILPVEVDAPVIVELAPGMYRLETYTQGGSEAQHEIAVRPVP